METMTPGGAGAAVVDKGDTVTVNATGVVVGPARSRLPSPRHASV
jgi:hypothetical protein